MNSVLAALCGYPAPAQRALPWSLGIQTLKDVFLEESLCISRLVGGFCRTGSSLREGSPQQHAHRCMGAFVGNIGTVCCKGANWPRARPHALILEADSVGAPMVGAGFPSSLVLMISRGKRAREPCHLGPEILRDASLVPGTSPSFPERNNLKVTS